MYREVLVSVNLFSNSDTKLYYSSQDKKFSKPVILEFIKVMLTKYKTRMIESPCVESGTLVEVDNENKHTVYDIEKLIHNEEGFIK